MIQIITLFLFFIQREKKAVRTERKQYASPLKSILQIGERRYWALRPRQKVASFRN